MRLFTIALLVAILSPLAAHAGEIGFAANQSCTVSADVVTCAPVVDRGSLVIEADVAVFTKLRDALTPGWAGVLVCNACDVAQGFPGCVAEGDQVATTQKKAALARLSCALRSIVIRADRDAARSSADASVDPAPDIGGGDPG